MTLKEKVFIAFFTTICACNLHNNNDNNEQSKAEVLWSYSYPKIHAFADAIQPVIEDGIAYIASDTSLVCRVVETDEEKWRVGLLNNTSITSMKLLCSSNKIFFNHNNYITAYNKQDGSIIWRTEVENIYIRDLTVMDQNLTHLFIGGNGGVVRLEKETGLVDLYIPISKLDVEDGSQSSRAIIIHNNDTLYVPFSYYEPSMPEIGGFVFCYNAQTGKEIWSYEVPNRYWVNGFGDSLLTGAGVKKCAIMNDVVAFRAGINVFALNRYTGEEMWETSFQSYYDGFSGVSIAAANDIIFAGSTFGHVYGLAAGNGTVLWDADIKYTMSSLFTTHEDRLYFANPMGGGLWVIDQLTGEVIWNGQPPGNAQDDSYAYFSPVAVENGYMINVGTKKVYCLTVP
ncbi:MAG: PQQ-binding-like beta-propeller repeat protein [Planctomycetia bacterium]|nr:PQQ-binding-like beta-propeller repeat protein [Planctomycetia bacterium]